MKKMNCLIVDDENRAVNTLKYLIHNYCGQMAEVTAAANDMEEAYNKIKDNKPDIVFLDLNLGSHTGFDLLHQLGAYEDMKIIIVTAYDDFALEAFKYNAVNYLLKPVDHEALIKSIERLYSNFNTGKQSSIAREPATDKERIFLPDRSGWASFVLKDIIYLEADNVYTNIYLSDGSKGLISKSLGYLYNLLLLHSQDFVRIQKSYIVNLRHVIRINNGIKCNLEMQGGAKVPVSNNMKREVLDIFLKTNG